MVLIVEQKWKRSDINPPQPPPAPPRPRSRRDRGVCAVRAGPAGGRGLQRAGRGRPAAPLPRMREWPEAGRGVAAVMAMAEKFDSLEEHLEKFVENIRQLGIIVSDFQPSSQAGLNQKLWGPRRSAKPLRCQVAGPFPPPPSLVP